VDGDVSVPLTPTEFRILTTLMGATDRVVRRHELESAAWPPGSTVKHNLLDQYVARIRRKLQEMDHAPRLVTVHGVGYRLFADGQ
jgi:DNA-binding response OmpR family regulator